MIETPTSKKQYRKLCELAIYFGFCYCYLCGEPILPDDDWNLDHKVPRHHKGKSVPSNLMPTHRECNTAKADLSLGQYRQIQELLKRKRGKTK